MDNDQKYRILIVEDGKLYQKDLVDTLRSSYELLVADTGKMALEILKDYQPHLILLDIILPDMNGFDLLRFLKDSDRTRSIPVIIITGLDNEKDEEKGLLLGAVDYIKKPFNHTIVKARVGTHMQIIKHIETIEQLSFIDALTGLPNRRKFDYQIEYEWRRAMRHQSSIGLLLLDLDHFKLYNDTYGHPQGDIMLQAVARVLKRALKRTTDIPCRWGGEEFAILLPDTTLEEAVIIGETIRANICNQKIPCLHKDVLTSMTVSIGVVSMVPTAHQPLSILIEKADQLLYKAKEQGRNQVRF